MNTVKTAACIITAALMTACGKTETTTETETAAETETETSQQTAATFMRLTTLPLETEEESDPYILTTEIYSCEDFTMMIPAGWYVHDIPYGPDGWKRLTVTVSDPSDPDNYMFFSSAFEPFFTNGESRDKWISFMPYLEYAPLLSGVNAEQVLRNWDSVRNGLRAGGYGLDMYIRKCRVENVLSSDVKAGSTDSFIGSETLCEVAVPDSDKVYVMDYLTTLRLAPASANLPEYYTAENNIGVCVDSELKDRYMDVMLSCMYTLDITGFNEKYLS